MIGTFVHLAPMALRTAIFTHYAELYGANRSMLEWVVELRGRGVLDPLVVLPKEGPLTGSLQAIGIPYAVVPFEPWMSERNYMGRPHHRIMQYLAYRKAARVRAAHNAALVPDAVTRLRAHGTQVVLSNSAAVPIGHPVARALGMPHVWHIRELPELHYRLHLDAGRNAYGRALGASACVVAISEAVKHDVLRYVEANTRIEVVPNGVLPRARYEELRQVMMERWAQLSPFRFVQVGLIHPGKGQVEAVEALAQVRVRFPQAKLVIAGTGRDKPLRQRISELGLEGAVELAGFVDDVPALLKRCHVLLSTSRDEAFGRTVVEAMASGLPVIGHDSGGTPELIQNGSTGRLYSGGVRPLAAAMSGIMSDLVGAQEMGRRAQAFAAANFSVERTADRMHALLLQAVR